MIRLRNVLAPALLCAVPALGACAYDRPVGPGDPSPPVDPDPPAGLTLQEARVSAANTAFGLALLRDLHPEEEEANLFLSPLSASMSLGMTMNGAAGSTFDAMRETLGFGELEEQEMNEAYRDLIRKLETADPGVQFKLANAIWYHRHFDVNPDFFQRAQDYFAAAVSPLDFLDPAAPDVINAWVEEQTEGRIRELIDEIDPLDRLFLVNAVYFKAPWTQPFQEHGTRDRPFTRRDGSRADVPTMVQDGIYGWFRDDDVQAVELLYADSAFSMVLVSPARGHDLDAFVADLDADRWNQWMDRFEASRVMLTMPKFRFEYGIQLRDPLARLGMRIAFEPWDADFSRIAPVDDLHISRVKQKTFIDVHELGTEAAAATATTVSVTSMPPQLDFDRPFLFAIRERATGTLLFLGRVGDPGA